MYPKQGCQKREALNLLLKKIYSLKEKEMQPLMMRKLTEAEKQKDKDLLKKISKKTKQTLKKERISFPQEEWDQMFQKMEKRLKKEGVTAEMMQKLLKKFQEMPQKEMSPLRLPWSLTEEEEQKVEEWLKENGFL